MADNYVNGWLLGLGLDTKPFDKSFKKVEERFKKLSDTTTAAQVKYQEQLDKQLATLKAQNELLKQRKPLTTSVPKAPMSPRSPSKSTQASFATSVRGVRKDVDDFRLQAQSMQMSERAGVQLAEQLKVIDSRLNAVKDNNGLRLIRQDLKQARRAAIRYQKEQKALNRTMSAGAFASKGLSDSLRNFARSWLSVFAVIGAASLAFRVAKELDSIKASFLAASGSAEVAARDFLYVRDVSLELGTSLTTAAKGYAQIATAGKAANLSLEQTREIFMAASEASTAFGLSAEDSSGIFRAMTQMLSKGKLMAEEVNFSLAA